MAKVETHAILRGADRIESQDHLFATIEPLDGPHFQNTLAAGIPPFGNR